MAVHPMSDRRMILLALGGVAAVAGVVVVVVAAVLLRDPVVPSGEIGTRTDISRELVAALLVGLVLAAGGITTAIWLVRAQDRARGVTKRATKALSRS